MYAHLELPDEQDYVSFGMLNKSINNSCYVSFLNTSWYYTGSTVTFKCGFVYKKDNRTALKNGLGLNDTTLAQLEALNSSIWSTVLSNQNSVNYLLNHVSGDIMFSAVSNSTIRGLITSSAYASSFSNNEHWGPILTLCKNNPPTVVSKQ